MESFLNRYRNITVLLLVIFSQLILLAIQVKNEQDIPLIRQWTVSAVTPPARIVEGVRRGAASFFHNYFLLHKADADLRRVQAERDRLLLENIALKNELNLADRAKALQVFQAQTPSKTLAASIYMTGAGANSKVVFVDRGSADGVMRGMGVVTADGVVGKVIAAYPGQSEVLLITDPEFAAGVMSNRGVRGNLKGRGETLCVVDYVPFEEKVEPGDVFYTSGDDRMFPRGFRVGVVKAVHPGQPFKEIYVDPSGPQRGLDDVLILIQGVHQEIPDLPVASQPVYIAPPPPDAAPRTDGQPAAPAATPGTEADKLRGVYKTLGEAQGHTYGEGEPGAKPPDFTKLPGTAAPTMGPMGPNPPAGNVSTPGPNLPAGKAVPTPGPNLPAGKAAPTMGPNPPAGKAASTPGPNPPAGKAAPGTPRTTAAGRGPAANLPAGKAAPPAGALPPDAARRANQAAGAPPGGPPQ